MKILYKNILIRNAKENDATILTKWWNDGKIMAHAGFPEGINTTVQKVKHQLQEEIKNHKHRLIIEYKDCPIGEMCFFPCHDAVEIGIKICEINMQNQGLGHTILTLFIHELFQKGVPKIVLSTDLNNLRAQHVYEKIGFQKYDIQYNYWKDHQGEMHSAIFYELLPQNFIHQRK